MSRRSARAAALQTLYQIDLTKSNTEKALQFAIEENGLKESQQTFTKSLVYGVISNLSAINSIIDKVTLEWELERIAVVERNILRIALYEMCYTQEVPLQVAVNEAIELGKTFSTVESGKFINGILGKVIENIDQYRQIPANTEV